MLHGVVSPEGWGLGHTVRPLASFDGSLLPKHAISYRALIAPKLIVIVSVPAERNTGMGTDGFSPQTDKSDNRTYRALNDKTDND